MMSVDEEIPNLNRRIRESLDLLRRVEKGEFRSAGVSELQPRFRQLLHDLRSTALIQRRKGYLGCAVTTLWLLLENVFSGIPWAIGSKSRQDEFFQEMVEVLASCLYGMGMSKECSKLGQLLGTGRGQTMVEYCDKIKTKPPAMIEGLDTFYDISELIDMFGCIEFRDIMEQKDEQVSSNNNSKLAQIRANSAAGFSGEIDKLLLARDSRAKALIAEEERTAGSSRQREKKKAGKTQKKPSPVKKAAGTSKPPAASRNGPGKLAELETEKSDVECTENESEDSAEESENDEILANINTVNLFAHLGEGRGKKKTKRENMADHGIEGARVTGNAKIDWERLVPLDIPDIPEFWVDDLLDPSMVGTKDLEWKQVGKTGDKNGTVPDIPASLRDLVIGLQLSPGCDECICLLPAPLVTPLGDRIFYRKSGTPHSCSKTFLLASIPPILTSLDSGDTLLSDLVSIVRPLKEREAPNGYKLCDSGVLTCSYKQKCSFAHSTEECRVWNVLREEKVGFKKLREYVVAVGSKVRSQPVVVAPGLSHSIIDTVTRIGSSHPEPENIPAAQEINLEGLQRLLGLLPIYDIQLTCLNCCANRKLKKANHNCMLNQIFCRSKNVKDSPWQRAIKHEDNLVICGNFHVALGGSNWQLGMCAEMLRERLICWSESRFSLPDLKDGASDYEAVLGCNQCSSVAYGSWSVVYSFPHICKMDGLFLRNEQIFPSVQKHLWLKIKEGPPFKPKKGYDICRHVERDCWLNKECKFAHSELEKLMWTLNSQGNMVISNCFFELRSNRFEVRLWKDVLGKLEEACNAQRKESPPPDIVEPREQVSSETGESTPRVESRQGRSRDSSICSTSTTSEQPVSSESPICPLDVFYICKVCFSASNGSRASYRAGESCDNKKTSHFWETNKHAAVRDGAGKLELVRSLPIWKGKVAIKHRATLCNFKATAGKKKHAVCDSYECNFAHNKMELKLWNWLFKKGLNVSDVAKDSEIKSEVHRSTKNAVFAAPAQWKNPMGKSFAQGMMSTLTMEEIQRGGYYCFVCDKSPANEEQYKAHSQNELHLKREKIDAQIVWKFQRPKSGPPYSLCDRHETANEANCTKAHSEAELKEWEERRKYVLEQSSVRWTEEHASLVARLRAQKDKAGIGSIRGVELTMDPSEDTITVSTGNSTGWSFYIFSEKPLFRVALVKEESITYFRFARLGLDNSVEKIEQDNGHGIFVVAGTRFRDSQLKEFYEVEVQFVGCQSDKTYDTEVVFDFGESEKLVTQRLAIHSGLDMAELDQLSAIIQRLPDQSQLWNSETVEIIWKSLAKKLKESQTVAKPSHEAVQNLQVPVTPQNFCKLMTSWLTVEQQARQQILSSFRLSTSGTIYSSLHWGASDALAPPGCQYVLLEVDSPFSEDVDLTALLMADCDFAFVSLVPPVFGYSGKIKVYEAELLGKHNSGFDFKGVTQNQVFLLMYSELTRTINKKPGDTVKLTVQFNLASSQFDQWRAAINRLSITKNMDMVFPDLNHHYRMWYKNSMNWWNLDPKMAKQPSGSSIKLNREQLKLVHHAVYANCSEDVAVPPLVVFGPFGTGKTQSMAFAVAQILLEEGGWSAKDGLVLICTHSHPTADMYLELIENMVQHKISKEDMRQLMVRLFPKGKRVDTLPDKVRPYVPVDYDGTLSQLSTQEIQHARVVICTLFGSNRLLQLSDEGHKLVLSHIFLDEAAQSLEVETLMPLCLASRKTRIVVAGDHNQIRPKVYLGADLAADLSKSYLEHLYLHYDEFDSRLDVWARRHYISPKLLFNINYRCHEGILEFISEEFYGKSNSLSACGHSPKTGIPALKFAPVERSEEKQLPDSTSWCNEEEAKMVASQVEILCRQWPKEWGDIDIGIAVPYHDQISVIKDCLYALCRSRGMSSALTTGMIRNNITIGKVITMQGKEFKTLVISTVLTRKLEESAYLNGARRNLEFLDDKKLINTALTRAKYSLVVVGDPVALCNYGKCKETWKNYIMHCSKASGSANNMSKSNLHHLESGVERGLEDHCSSKKIDRAVLKQLNPDKLLQQLIEKTEQESQEIEYEKEEHGDIVYPSDGEEDLGEELSEEIPIAEGNPAILHIVSTYNIFATPLDRTKDVIHIRSRKYCQRAFSGDHVLVKITDTDKQGKHFGKVTGIMKKLFHPEEQMFACFADPKVLGSMIPIDSRIPKMNTNPKKGKKRTELKIYRLRSDGSPELAEEFKINMINRQENIFIVMFVTWEENNYCPFGMIVEKISLIKNKNQVADLIEQGLRIININQSNFFPTWDLSCYRRKEEIESELSSMAQSKSADRKDFRSLLCFTIDPPGSLDLDDAISLEKIGPDFLKVGIHIADVSCAIKKDDPIDREAKQVTQTFYSEDLDKPKHMIPEDLSTNFLSLTPGKERPAVSVFFTMCRKSGKITDAEITRSWIISKSRLTYEEAEEILSKKIKSPMSSELQLLHFLTTKQRERRLGVSGSKSVDISHLEHPMAELLVSELMILTNHQMAKKLLQMYPNCVPVRKQLPPSNDLLEEWKEQHKTAIPLSFKHGDLAGSVRGLQPDVYKIPTDMWKKIENGSDAVKQSLVGAEDLQPFLVPSAVGMRMIQEKSFYTPSSKALGVLSHHQLNLDFYIHFTSPIRRYIDIVAHRMLLAGLDGKECPYSVQELQEICDHCTEMSWKQRDYSVNCFNLKNAVSNQKTPVMTDAIISKVESLSVSFEFPSFEKRMDSLKLMKFSQLELAKNPKMDENCAVLLQWKKELYSALETKAEGIRKSKKDSIKIHPDLNTTQVPIDLWKEIRNCIIQGDEIGLQATVLKAKKQAKTHSYPKLTSETCSENVIQKQTVRFETTWKESSVVKVQLSARIIRGMLLPSVQLICLTPEMRFCLEHTRDPAGCFALRPENVIHEKYKNVLSYQKAWLQILMMEAAVNVVYDRSSVSIKDLKMSFKKRRNGTMKMTFQLGENFCRRRMIYLTNWDQKGTEDPQLIAISRLDAMCVQVPMKNYVWVGHFVSKNVQESQDSKKNNAHKVSCELIHSGSVVPVEFGEEEVEKLGSVEIFFASDPEKRMQHALSNLHTVSPLIQEIALGKAPTTSVCGLAADVKKEKAKIIAQTMCDPPLNKYQRDAILTSMSQPFTAIWGPPGTGKTVTAVQLACCFAKENRMEDCSMKNLASFPKLLYVAPSNKAVNVVGRVFKRKVCPRDNSLSVVRIYAKELEIVDFPLPFDRFTNPNSADLDKEIKDISLHHMIRNGRNTRFAGRIRDFDSTFQEIRCALQKGEEPKQTIPEIFHMMKQFKNIVKLAERQVMRNCDIILCTSTAANPHRLHFLLKEDSDPTKGEFQIKQVILDEASMSCEPESLIPLVTTDCETVVLVGDHQQLSPVVLCNEAKEFGMDSTLFSKYQSRAFMLRSQYRMHETIAEFPSRLFYSGLLELGRPDEQKVQREVWPGFKERIAFCDCEGVEERRVVTTDEACQMSASNKVEIHHVLRIVQGLLMEGVSPGSIAILSQYRAQTGLIEEKLKTHNMKEMEKVTVQTVIKSQGGEWDYVIFTTVRSMPVAEIDMDPSMAWIQKNLGSIADLHQVCVALTRAREGLVIIGNSNLLKVDETWKQLIGHYKKKQCLVDAAKFMN